MNSSLSYFDRKPSSSIRPGLSHLQASPSSPHTPNRQISSTFSSPSVSFRAEEEPLVFEVGNRHLSAGFAGESSPRCRLSFGPESSRRVGDYRRWLPGYEARPKKKQRLSTWGKGHELWKMDLRGFDVGIVGDKIERAVREAYTKYLLLDPKSRKVYLILPSVLPQQVLNKVLCTLFENFQIPSITLLSPPILSTTAAGCRSGLVVDIGWTETIITAVYEYREICQYRTLRGMKILTRKMALMLDRHERQRGGHSVAAQVDEDVDNQVETTLLSVEQVEEIVVRVGWCRQRSQSSATTASITNRFNSLALEEHDPQTSQSEGCINERDLKLLPIQSPFSPFQSLQLPFFAFSEVVEESFFAPRFSAHNLDDHEQPLPELIFKCLLSLPPDVRSITMSRIIYTGGGSQIPGLRLRIIEDVEAIIDQRGFNPVLGEAADERKRKLQEISAKRQSQKPADTDEVLGQPFRTPASEVAQIDDEIDQKLRKEQEKNSTLNVSGTLRSVESLGPWAGGSLLGTFRVKGIVDIERDIFLQHGLGGAKRESDINPIQSRKSYGAEISKTGIGERASWTLGAWA